LRRPLVLVALAAAFLPVAVASFALEPVRRSFEDVQIPRLRAGTRTK
jgi:hypothetical protein